MVKVRVLSRSLAESVSSNSAAHGTYGQPLHKVALHG